MRAIIFIALPPTAHKSHSRTSCCTGAVAPRIEIRGGRPRAREKEARVSKVRGRGGGGSSGRTMDRRSHDDPWVMRVLAFLIVDDAAKEHAARPLIGPRLSLSLFFTLFLSDGIVRVIYRKLLPARSKCCCCLRRLRIKVNSHSSPVARFNPSRATSKWNPFGGGESRGIFSVSASSASRG